MKPPDVRLWGEPRWECFSSRVRLVALGVARVAPCGGPVEKQRDLDLWSSSADDTIVCLHVKLAVFNSFRTSLSIVFCTMDGNSLYIIETIFSQYRKISHLPWYS